MTGIKNLTQPYRGLPREIYILFFSRIVNSIGCFVQPLMTLILTGKIGMAEDAAGLYITMVSVLSVPSLLFGGYIADRVGRKAIMLLSQGVGAVTIISCAFIKPGMTMAYLLIFSAMLYAMSSPAYNAMLADLTEPSNRKGAYSLLYMGWNIGFSLGPVIGGFLYKDYLSLIFIGDGLTTLLSILLVLFFVGESKKANRETQGELTEEWHLEKEVKGSVFTVLMRRPILVFFALIVFCYQFEYSQMGFALPLHIKTLFLENGSFYFGLLGGFNGVIVIAMTPIITKLTRHINTISVISAGGLCYGLSFGMLAFVGQLPLFFVSMLILTIGEVLISINSGTFIADHTPASHRGRVSSILPLIYGAGFALGPMAMGKVIARYDMPTAWLLIGIMGLLSGGLMILLKKYDQRQRTM